MEKYWILIKSLDDRTKKYIHYKSLYNFILHTDEIDDEIDNIKSVYLLNEFLSKIENNGNEIDRFISYNNYLQYLEPLVPIYEKIGFKEMHHIKYYLAFSIPIDIFFGLFFLGFPYPLLTLLVGLKYLYKRIVNKDNSRYYSMFY